MKRCKVKFIKTKLLLQNQRHREEKVNSNTQEKHEKKERTKG